MNSLFLGPYRQSDIDGLCSRAILHYLYRHRPDSHRLISRNIYLDTISSHSDTNDAFIQETETYTNNISQLIQHVPVNSIYLSQYIQENICIPILDNTLLQDDDIYRLNMCSKVLVDSYSNYKRLYNHIQNLELITYDPIIVSSDLPKINLGIYINTKKMYFIGSYQKNKDLLKDLILSFVLFSQKYDNLSLILFLTNTNNKDIQEIQTFVQKAYTDLRICNVFNKIVCTGVTSTINSFISCHMVGDVYLHINDDSRNDLNCLYAQKFNNLVLDIADVPTDRTVIRNNIIQKNRIYETPTQSGLLVSLDNLLANKSTNLLDKKELSSVIWPY